MRRSTSVLMMATFATFVAFAPFSASAGCATSPPDDGPILGDGSEGEAVKGDRPASSGRHEQLSPEISHSRGVEGGIVLLWPRVVPKAETLAMHGPAKALQDRLKAMLEEHFPGRPIDVRPEPERVCPRLGGCTATSVGLLIGVKDGQCIAVVIVSPPGESDQLLMPWAGLMSTKLTVPFREPPESSIQLQQLVPCDQLPVATLEREDRVKEALRIAQ